MPAHLAADVVDGILTAGVKHERDRDRRGGASVFHAFAQQALQLRAQHEQHGFGALHRRGQLHTRTARGFHAHESRSTGIVAVGESPRGEAAGAPALFDVAGVERRQRAHGAQAERLQRVAQIIIHWHQSQRGRREILGALPGGDDRDAVGKGERVGFTHGPPVRARSPGGGARGHARIGDGDAGIGVPLLRDGKQGARELRFAADGIEAVGAHPPHAGGTGDRGDLGTGGQ